MKKRVIGLDLIRVLATIFIICIHFYLNSGFYDIKFSGWKLGVAFIFRWLFFICVPLFIILTGYLKSNKEINKDHYKSIIPILTSYVFIAIITILFRINYMEHEFTILKSVISIFNFTANNYSWYLELYIGLFLLIPFLNILWKNLKSNKNKVLFLVSLASISTLSTLTSDIVIDGVSLDIFPNWWNNIYPLLYYFIGCYIKDFTDGKIKYKLPSKKQLFIMMSVLLLFEAVVSYYYFLNIRQDFSWNFFGGYNCILTVIIATLFFLIFYNFNINNKFIIKLLSIISNLSLDIYLFSWISDKFIYSYFKEHIAFGRDLIYYAPLCVLISFIIAFILSLLKKYIFILYNKIQIKLKNI